MSALLFTCSRYNKENISNYTLSIQISLDGLSFAIRDYLSNCYIHFEHIPNSNANLSVPEYMEQISAYVPESGNYKQVFILVDEPKFVSIPHAFGEADAASEFYKLNYPLCNTERLLISECGQGQPRFVYPLYADLYDFLDTAFTTFTIRHISEIGLWNLKSLHNFPKGAMDITIFKNYFYLTVLKASQLVISNSFPYHYSDDLLFYTLNAFTKLELSQTLARVRLSGEIDRSSELITGMQRFIKHVNYEEWPAAYNFSDELFKMAPYRFSKLFLTPLCE